MARWKLREAYVVADKRYKAGATLADTIGNALAGDKVEATVGVEANVHPSWEPLDGAATTLKSQSKYAGVPLSATIPGNMSID
jgi:hypothetical protein